MLAAWYDERVSVELYVAEMKAAIYVLTLNDVKVDAINSEV